MTDGTCQRGQNDRQKIGLYLRHSTLDASNQTHHTHHPVSYLPPTIQKNRNQDALASATAIHYKKHTFSSLAHNHHHFCVEIVSVSSFGHNSPFLVVVVVVFVITLTSFNANLGIWRLVDRGYSSSQL